MAVLPPIAASTWPTSVVGAAIHAMPRRNVAAANPVASVTVPPPTADHRRRDAPARPRRGSPARAHSRRRRSSPPPRPRRRRDASNCPRRARRRRASATSARARRSPTSSAADRARRRGRPARAGRERRPRAPACGRGVDEDVGRGRRRTAPPDWRGRSFGTQASLAVQVDASRSARSPPVPTRCPPSPVEPDAKVGPSVRAAPRVAGSPRAPAAEGHDPGAAVREEPRNDGRAREPGRPARPRARTAREWSEPASAPRTASASANGTPRPSASRWPTVDLPAPMKPTRAVGRLIADAGGVLPRDALEVRGVGRDHVADRVAAELLAHRTGPARTPPPPRRPPRRPRPPSCPSARPAPSRARACRASPCAAASSASAAASWRCARRSARRSSCRPRGRRRGWSASVAVLELQLVVHLEPRRPAFAQASPISTPFMAWMPSAAAASRASRRSRGSVCDPRPGGQPKCTDLDDAAERVLVLPGGVDLGDHRRLRLPAWRQPTSDASARSKSAAREVGQRPASRRRRCARRGRAPRCRPAPSRSLAIAPTATRASVSRADARSSTLRTSSRSYFMTPARSA